MVALTEKTTNKLPRLKALFLGEIRTRLQKDLDLKNLHQVPRLDKVVINVGIGRNKEDKKFQEMVLTALARLTGQHPVETVAKNSIAGFKLREGQKIGAKVTLRGDRMYEFVDRLINIVLPRVRDFRGVANKSFDSTGNYHLGIREQSVFPELDQEDVSVLFGLEISFVIKGGDADKSKALLVAFGLPFERPLGQITTINESKEIKPVKGTEL